MDKFITSPLGQIAGGQILLMLCCLFYLAWWRAAFRPGVINNGLENGAGILLACMLLTACPGIVMCYNGIDALPSGIGWPSGEVLGVVGVLVYLVLLAGTTLIFHRQVTTELLLLVGWAVLELCVLKVLVGGGCLDGWRLTVSLVVVAAASVLGLIAYLWYYRLPAEAAFICGMVPLIVDMLGMGSILVLAFLL